MANAMPRTGIPGLDICKKHNDQPMSFYCETCEAPSCPLCLPEVHPEPGHSYKDLDSAVQERIDILQEMAKNCEEVKSEVDSNLEHGNTVLEELDSALQDVIKQMDEAEENARRDFEYQLKRCRQHSMQRLEEIKAQRTQSITAGIESLKKDRNQLNGVMKLANQVSKATKYEVALTYATISKKINKIEDLTPVSISKAHAKLAFKAHESSREMLIAEDLGNFVMRPGMRKSKVSFSDHVKSSGVNFEPIVASRHGIRSTSQLPSLSSFDPEVLARHGVKLAPPPQSPPPDKVQNGLASEPGTDLEKKNDDDKSAADGAVTLACQFGRKEGDGKLHHARAVAISPTSNDIVIADYDTNQLKVFSSNGEYKFKVDTRQDNEKKDSKPWDVAVTQDGEFLVIDKTPTVKVYDAAGKYVNQFPAVSPDKQPSDSDDVGLYCIATDVKGRVLLGAGNFYVSIHSAAREGCHVSSISVSLPPGFMTATSQGHIIVGSWSQQKVLVINEEGEVLHTLQTPAGIPSWRPRGVCCSHDDEIFVANQVAGKNAAQSGIHRYQVHTGEHVECITHEVKAPLGIAVLADKGIVLTEKTLVKVFHWKEEEES